MPNHAGFYVYMLRPLTVFDGVLCCEMQAMYILCECT